MKPAELLERLAAFARTRAGRAAIATVVAVLAAAGITITVVDEHDGGHHTRTITIHVDGVDKDHARDDTLKLSPPATKYVKGTEAGRINQDIDPMKDETVGSLAAPGTELKSSPDPQAREVYRDSQEAAKRTTIGSDKPLPPGPLASPSFPGCRTAFVVNQSSRGASRPAVIFWHYTAGPEIPGWADINGLTSLANNPRAQVSWTFSIDREGHCNYTVPLERKAWTQAAGNPWGVGIEVVGRGNEPDYAGTAGFQKLAAVTIRVGKLYGIPMRPAIIAAGCRLVRSGIATHWQLGACGGGHVDIKPYQVDQYIRKVQAIARAGSAPGNVSTWCRKLNWYRHEVRAHHNTTSSSRALARTRKGLLAKHHYACLATGPVRT